MRRRLHAIGGKVLVRHPSPSHRAKIWVDVKELRRSGYEWLEMVDVTADGRRVRQMVEELIGRQGDLFARELKKILQRVAALEEGLEELRSKLGRRGTR
jgi:hypothetical protein